MSANKRVLGHLDKRRRLTRCQSCSLRRIKCEGVPPCNYCSRTGKQCLPATPVQDGYKFIAATADVYAKTTTGHKPTTHDRSVYMDLFAAFIQRCQFTSGFSSVNKEFYCLIHSSRLLHDLALAIGALEASRRASCSHSHTPNKARAMSFRCYGSALSALRQELDRAGAAHREDVLWCTFLCGLFELVSESSGERWAQHMFHGTSKILSLVGPTGLSTSLHREFFGAFRALELNRAILFGDDTFLSKPEWDLHYSNRYSPLSQERVLWDPVDTLFTLKLRVASFAKRFFDQIERIPPSTRPLHSVIHALAHEGIEITKEIRQWHQNYSESVVCETAYTQLACMDFHALTLFLCQLYGYYSCWGGVTIPSLTRDCVEAHVNAIIDLAEVTKIVPHFPGVLLLFALRIAGVHATDLTLMQKVIEHLDSIYSEGFVVSEKIKSDLKELWDYRRRPDCPQTP